MPTQRPSADEADALADVQPQRLPAADCEACGERIPSFERAAAPWRTTCAACRYGLRAFQHRPAHPPR